MTASAQPDSTLAKLADGSLAGHWTLDPARSSVRLKTASMWGIAKINGTFTELSGDATVEGATVTRAQIVIGAASIETKNGQRDKHLRSNDFLDVGEHPNIVFTLDSIAPAVGAVAVSGSLTVAKVTKPLTVEVVVTHNDAATITLTTELDVDRRDYGLTWNKLGMASVNNAVSITAVFTRN